MSDKSYNTSTGNPPWRKTLYKESMCQAAYDVLAAGGSLAKVAATLKISLPTLADWRREHPGFSSAVSEGLAVAESIWDDPDFRPEMHAQRYKLNMQNRFRWADRSESALTGADGGAIKTESRHSFDLLTPEQAAAIAREYLVGEKD